LSAANDRLLVAGQRHPPG